MDYLPIIVAVAAIGGFLGFMVGRANHNKSKELSLRPSENPEGHVGVRNASANNNSLSVNIRPSDHVAVKNSTNNNSEDGNDNSSTRGLNHDTDLARDIQARMSDGGSKIEAIKEVRERTGLGLTEAKNFVESLENEASSGAIGAGQTHSGANNDIERVKELLRNGRKIEALKTYRQMSGLGLKEAKDELDRIERSIRLGLDR